MKKINFKYLLLKKTKIIKKILLLESFRENKLKIGENG